MAKYDTQINLLERLIHNWYDIKTSETFYRVFIEHQYFRYTSPVQHKGLCIVANMYHMNDQERWKMFEDWMYYSDSVAYPVGGKHEYDNIDLITDNPKRLHLAVHCLQWLRQRNIEED